MKRGPCYRCGRNATYRERTDRYACFGCARGADRHKRLQSMAIARHKRIKKRDPIDQLRDELTKVYVGNQSCLVGRVLGTFETCSESIERAHIHHRGMGGKKVPWYRNTWPACASHHRGTKGEHTMGVQSFDAYHNLTGPNSRQG